MLGNLIIQKYTDPINPGSFSGLSGFKRNNKNLGKVFKVLRKLPQYTLHKSIRYTFPRNQTIVNGIDYQWQIDLIDASNIAGSNNNYKYIFTCIDVFSKYAWAIPILNKQAKSCKQVFEKILTDGRKPSIVYSDLGNEFKGEFKKFIESKNIKIILTTSKKKATIIERFNRTLKEKLYRFFENNSSNNLHKKRYLEVLDKLLNSYNNSFHRSIKTIPVNVNKNNEKQIFENLYGFNYDKGDDRIIKIKYKKGTLVRIVKNKNLFEKGYTAKWLKQIYIIHNIIPKYPVVYQLKNLKTDKIEPEEFYEQELQKVDLNQDNKETSDEEEIELEQTNIQENISSRLRKRK